MQKKYQLRGRRNRCATIAERQKFAAIKSEASTRSMVILKIALEAFLEYKLK